jgi:hypothetical protein
MKKVILTVLLSLALVSMVYAEPLKLADLGEVTSKLPAFDNGIAWDLDQKGVAYTSTINLVEWKGLTLNGGYLGVFENANEQSEHGLILGLSYEITNLEKLGVTIPILKYVKFEPMVYAGYDSINLKATTDSEFIYGLGVKFLEVKF